MTDDRKKILLLDDEELILEVTSEILEHFGYSVSVSATGEETLEKYKNALNEKTPYELVIIDLTLTEGLNGLETFEMLKKIDPEVKAIISSGHFKDGSIDDYKKIGFKDYLFKPYDMDQLKVSLDKIFQN